jgi:hypothetical protein
LEAFMRFIIALALALIAVPAAAQAPCRQVNTEMIKAAVEAGAEMLSGSEAAAFMADFNAVPPVTNGPGDVILFVKKDGHHLLGILVLISGDTYRACTGEAPPNSDLGSLIQKHFGPRA